jgi:hypothetical protein
MIYIGRCPMSKKQNPKSRRLKDKRNERAKAAKPIPLKSCEALLIGRLTALVGAPTESSGQPLNLLS